MAQKLIDPIENDLRLLLDNHALDLSNVDCHQSSAAGSAVLMRNVCYIVSGVLINENREVLLIQEAKASCRGTWYLPAGRMEPNESIVEAVQREVTEETGYEFQPTTLLCVETNGGYWFRFTFTGTITGGKLKTLDDADSESLQARWTSLDDLTPEGSTNLRHRDIIPLINVAASYKSSTEKHADLLPINNAHRKVYVRIVLLHQTQNSDMYVLMGVTATPHLPVTVIQTTDRSAYPYSLLQDIFADSTNQKAQILGILSLEHSGKPKYENDGLCLTFLLTTPNNTETPPKISSKYQWQCITDSSLKESLCHKMQTGMTVPLLLLK